MKSRKYLFTNLAIVLVLAFSLVLAGCSDSDDVVPAAGPAATFVGSDQCQTCHPTIYSSSIESGHNFKLNKIEGAAEPTYPVFTPGITGALALIDDDDTESGDPNPGNGTDNTLGTPDSYADVSYVIGGYNWKARFVDADGYIVTGTEVQYNLATGAMGGYHNNETDKPYNCGNCHTTGWMRFDAANNPNRQDGLAGMDGTWDQEGIQCESCHGPGSNHVQSQSAADITRVASARTTADFLAADMGSSKAVACSECHTRDGEKDYPDYTSAYETAIGATDVPGGRIIADSNLIRHHEQFDELLGVDPNDAASGSTRSTAFNTEKLGCTGCHDPHKTSVYDSDTDGMLDGVDNTNGACLACHDALTYDPANSSVPLMSSLNCIDCHMPFLAKSAISNPAEGTGPVTGDIRSHIFRIDMTQTDQFTSDGKFAFPYITKEFACLTCHNGVTASDHSNIDETDFVFHEPPSTTAAYIGTHHCQTCHPTIYSSFIESGHNFKLNKIEGGAEPTYPVFTPGITGALALIDDDDTESGDPKAGTDNTLGTPASYSDVSYVIGGYNWKARFVDADGYIVTGTKVQYNLETGAMGGYHNNETDKPYNCGNCHTTGWKHFDAANNQSRQGGLAGMDGTWMMEGVQCESCHGAASLHVNSGNKDDITRVATARTTADFLAPDMAFGLPVACSECHTRDGEKDDPSYTSAFTTASGLDIPGGRIAAVGNLIRHHEQFDELLGVDPDTPAAGSTRSGAFSTAKLGCTGCHDPHQTSVYDSDTDGMLDGVDNSNAGCLTAGCHDASTYDPVNANTINMTGLNCIDCHMPFLAKSAISVPAEGTGPVTGDIRSHIFRIDMTQTDQFTSDGKFAYPYLTKAFACLTCHNGVDASDRSGQDDTNYVFHPAAP